MARRQDRYWDSVCFLAWLMKEEDRVDECAAVLEAAAKGTIRIVTSAVTIAEVVHLKRRKPIPVEDADVVRAFFKQPYILVVQLDRFIAEEAQRMVWDHDIDPKDAMHVATAISARVAQLDTFDGPLIRKSGEVGVPPLVIGRPSVPPEYQPKSDAKPDTVAKPDSWLDLIDADDDDEELPGELLGGQPPDELLEAENTQ